jgi:uncharacterized protein
MNPILVFFLIILVLLIAACLLISFSLTRRHSQKVDTNPSEVGLVYRSVFFPSTDGITLSGWWIPAEDSPNTVIFLHGFAGSMDPDLKYAPVFHEHGFNVLMFDFRAHGRSGGKHTSLGALEVRDVLGAYDFAKQSNSWSVGLLGFSMGGRAALLTAARCKEFSAVISDGGPLRLHTAIKADLIRRKTPHWAAPILAAMCLVGASLRLGVNLFWNDPLVLAKKIADTPTMLIHGDLDPNTTIAELDKMVERSKFKIKLWRVADARHREVDQADAEGYMQRVVGFFERNLKLD